MYPNLVVANEKGLWYCWWNAVVAIISLEIGPQMSLQMCECFHLCGRPDHACEINPAPRRGVM
jgi:hypothetical protein